MAEYIEREALLDSIGLIQLHFVAHGDNKSLFDIISEAPAADVAPVRHGRWEQIKEWATKAKYRCSICGREIMSGTKVNIDKYPYCHCGARMDLEEAQKGRDE